MDLEKKAADVPEKAAELPEKGEYGMPEKEVAEVLLENEATGIPEKGANGMPEKETNGVPEKEANGVPEKEANGVPEKEAAGIPAKKATGVPEKEAAGIPAKKATGVPEKRASRVPEKELCSVLVDVGIQLLVPPENVEELLEHLNNVETLLSLLRQNCSSAVRSALMPIKDGLISDKLFGHLNFDVRVSVLSCIHQLMKFTAPEAPYENDAMKVIFQQTLVLLDTNLILFSGSCYKKALQILETSAKVRSFLILLDIGCEPLVTQTFQLFLDNIRPKHPEAVFTNMENIMTRLIEESDKLSVNLLKPLLTSVKKESQTISPLSWKLGMKVLNNCSSRVKPFLKKSVEQMRLDAENYTKIGASIWPDAFVEDNVMKEAAVQTSDPGEIQSDDILEKNKDNSCESMDEDFSKALVCYDKNSSLEVIPNEPVQPETLENGESFLRGERRRGTPSSEVSRKRKNNGKPGGSPKRLSLGKSSLKSKSLPSDQSSRGKGQPKKGTSRNEVVKKEPAFRSDLVTVQNLDAEESLLSTFKGSGVQGEYDEKLIGSRVKVLWPSDREFYTGTVESYDPSRKKHKIVYLDGDVECLSLKKERWFLLDDVTTKQDEDVKPQSSALVPFKPQNSALVPVKPQSSALVPVKPQSSSLVPVKPQTSALVPVKSKKKKASQPAKEKNSTGSRSKKKESTSSSKKRLPEPRVRKSGNTSLSSSAQTTLAIKAEVEDTPENKKEKTLSEIIRYTRRPKPERASPDSLELLSSML